MHDKLFHTGCTHFFRAVGQTFSKPKCDFIDIIFRPANLAQINPRLMFLPIRKYQLLPRPKRLHVQKSEKRGFTPQRSVTQIPEVAINLFLPNGCCLWLLGFEKPSWMTFVLNGSSGFYQSFDKNPSYHSARSLVFPLPKVSECYIFLFKPIQPFIWSINFL